MRSLLWDSVQAGTGATDKGAPVVGATVNVYQWNTTTPITQTMYASPTSSVPLANPLTTDQNGKFECWVNGNGGIVSVLISGGTPAITTPQTRTLAFTRDTGHDPVSVKAYGAVGDGITDDTAAINAALSDPDNAGTTVVLPLAPDDVGYRITGTLYIGNGTAESNSDAPNSLRVIGISGAGEVVAANKIETDLRGFVPLLWYGAADTPMMMVRGPIQNVEIAGLGFDCRSITNCGIRSFAMQQSWVHNCKVIRNASGLDSVSPYRTLTAAYDLRAYAAGDATPNSLLATDNGANGCRFEGLYAVSGVPGSAGFAVGSQDSPPLDGTHPYILSQNVGPDLSQCVFIDCIARMANGVAEKGVGLALRYTDAITFVQCTFVGDIPVSVEVPPSAIASPDPDANGLDYFPNYAQFIGVHVDNGRVPPDGSYLDFRLIEDSATWIAEQKIIFDPIVNSLDSAYTANIDTFGYGWTTHDKTTNRSGLIGNWVVGGDLVVGDDADIVGSMTAREGVALASGLGVGSGQIAFPSTQNPSGVANTLDDYEEGSWTPTVSATSETGTGGYIKVGRAVLAWGALTITTIGAGSTGTISGLPFAADFSCSGCFSNWNTLSGTYVYLAPQVNSAASALSILGATGATASLGGANPLQSGTTIRWQITYRTAL